MRTPPENATPQRGSHAATPEGRAKRFQILQAAMELIRVEGVHAASISAIVKASHSSAGSIYHHFANKQDIVLAVAQASVVDPLEEILERSSDAGGASPGTLLRMMTDAVMGGDVQSELIVQLWAGSSNEPALKEIVRGRMSDVQDGLTREIAAWLAAQGDPNPDGRAVRLAHVTMGLAMGLLAERTILDDIDRHAYVEEAARLLDASVTLVPSAATD